jgi:hypothetical protein
MNPARQQRFLSGYCALLSIDSYVEPAHRTADFIHERRWSAQARRIHGGARMTHLLD